MPTHPPQPPAGGLPAAPEVTPTPEEWARPLEYVVSLLERFEDYGEWERGERESGERKEREREEGEEGRPTG